MRRLVALAIVSACSSSPQKVSPVAPPPAAEAQPAVPDVAPTLDALREGSRVKGWRVISVYTDDAGHRVGARFVHDRTGFQFDYLRIETAPQGYLWVTTPPTSDKGEPHTQEHLLLGKGNRGRRFGSNEVMRLAESSAFTDQWHTVYHFNTVAGPEAYWDEFADQLDTLLHPDYTDEEIRREVRNFGVDKAGLEEKGTVYNEMVRAYETPDAVAYHELSHLVYGATHPLSFESGGFPSAIRTMTPSDIRTFHHDHYTLPNMGLIAAYPSTMSLESVLARSAAVLDKQAGTGGHVFGEAEFPKPAAAAPGTMKIFDYPDAEASGTGKVVLGWPASRHLDLTELTLLELFVGAVAGDETTPLYGKLVDGKTRVIDTGATALGPFVSHDLGQPVALFVEGMRADKLDKATLESVRTIVMQELDRIAKLPPNDPALLELDKRVKARVVETRRSLAKFLDTPPGFGERGSGTGWFTHLDDLAKVPSFEKSITMKTSLAAIDQILAQPGNPWRDRIATWGLTTQPYVVAAKPSPALRKQLDDERAKRIADELVRLQGVYKTADAAATLAKYQTDYDSATHELEASKAASEMPALVASPPMTLDDSLKYETGELGPVRTFTAMFDSMQSMRIAVAFDFSTAVAPADQMFLAGFPELLEKSGVIENGKPISATEMKDRLRDEVLGLDVSYIGNNRTLREELSIAGQGLGLAEAKRSLAWIRRVMLAPDWRPENLPRLRDVVAQTLTATRQRMQGSEESWVEDPRDAWWHQDALQAHANSFLTQAFDLQRLRWMLADPGDPKLRAEVIAAVTAIKPQPRAALVAAAQKLGDKLSPEARVIAAEVGKDLAVLVGDLPDGSLAADWTFLTKQFAKDFSFGAPAALNKLEAIRSQIVRAAKARIVEVGSSANEQALAGEVKALVDAIPTTAPQPVAQAPKSQFRARVNARIAAAKQTQFFGLYAPSTSSGVHVNHAQATHYSNTDDEAVLDYLAGNLYTGHGAHSIFSQTWGAGLAYSNGLRPRVDLGGIDYYAERCPLLPQTLKFVIEQLRAAKVDPNIARYAIAEAFQSRVARGFEVRAEHMAGDLVDQQPPDMVRAFRTKVLAQANRPDLAKVLFDRMLRVYGHVLPGLGKLAPSDVPFVIGNAKQLAAYQDYLHTAIGKSTQLVTLYPRDFWLP